MRESLKKFFGFVVFDILETIVIALAIFVIIYVFIVSPHIIIGESMEKDFHNGEFLLVNEILYRFQSPQRGDVIVFKFDPTHDYIKRIIGLPGDKIEVANGSVFVNGFRLVENAYVSPNNPTYGLDFLQNNKTITVPQDDYFVLGDNRDESSDSREWGFVNKSVIEGKALVVYWPIEDFNIVSSVSYKKVGDTLVASKE